MPSIAHSPTLISEYSATWKVQTFWFHCLTRRGFRGRETRQGGDSPASSPVSVHPPVGEAWTRSSKGRLLVRDTDRSHKTLTFLPCCPWGLVLGPTADITIHTCSRPTLSPLQSVSSDSTNHIVSRVQENLQFGESGEEGPKNSEAPPFLSSSSTFYYHHDHIISIITTNNTTNTALTTTPTSTTLGYSSGSRRPWPTLGLSSEPLLMLSFCHLLPTYLTLNFWGVHVLSMLLLWIFTN